MKRNWYWQQRHFQAWRQIRIEFWICGPWNVMDTIDAGYCLDRI